LGATGFIGGQIVIAAHLKGWHVRAARRNPNSVGALSDIAPNERFEWVYADLANADSLFKAMRGYDIVFHAAATYPQNFRDIAHEVALAKAEMQNVIEAAQAARVSKLIYTSSLTTLTATPPPQINIAQLTTPLADENRFYKPGSVQSAYFEAKFAMEQMALQAAQNLDVCILLPTAVFGPGDIKPTTSIVIRDSAKLIRRGLPLVYFDAVINAVDGRDVAQAHVMAAELGKRGERYIIGGTNASLLSLMLEIAHALNKKPHTIKIARRLVKNIVKVSDWLPFTHMPENFRTFEYWQPVSDAKIRSEFGYTSRPLQETVRDTLRWFEKMAM
jgi:dihydroflavonol-4-reductase